jgi:hypothetical protein
MMPAVAKNPPSNRSLTGPALQRDIKALVVPVLNSAIQLHRGRVSHSLSPTRP